ncbi:hypothetical protein YC2023_091849 [Brassica napus]
MRWKRRSTTTLLRASPPASVVLSVRRPLETTTNDDCVAVVKTRIIKGLLAPFELSTEAPPPESSSSNQVRLWLVSMHVINACDCFGGNKEMEMITRSQERAGSQEMDQTRWNYVCLFGSHVMSVCIVYIASNTFL